MFPFITGNVETKAGEKRDKHFFEVFNFLLIVMRKKGNYFQNLKDKKKEKRKTSNRSLTSRSFKILVSGIA